MRLPALHPRKVNKVLAKDGWIDDHQKGAYHYKVKEGYAYSITVPYHGGKDVARGTLQAILKEAEISRERFFRLLRNPM